VSSVASRPLAGAARAAVTAPGTVLLLALLAGQAGLLVLTPILAEVARDLGVSVVVAGQLRTVTGLVAGVAALALGRVARRVPLRDLLLAGAALLAAGSLASAAAPSFWVLAAAQVPIALAVALLVSAGAAAAGEWARPEERARVLSRTLMGPALAWVLGMPLVGIAAERSWRLSFLVLPLAASALAGGALALCRRERLPKVRPLVRLGPLLREPVVGRWALAELLVASAWVGTLVYSGALFVEEHGASLALTGVILGVVAAAYLPGNALAARLAGRVPVDVQLRRLTPAGAVGVLAFGAVRPSLGVSVALLAALGLVMGGRTFAGGAYGLEASPERRLALMGLRTAALQFGYLVGAAAGGLALLAGGWTALGVAFSLVLVAAWLLYLAQPSVAREAP
jgi:MFS transporter, DHA1 family, inner membrane transport protein